MPSPHAIERFLDVLRVIDAGGFEVAIIGGCAVGAYARLSGHVVISEDLDLYVAPEVLEELLDFLETTGATIVKRPQPRSTPVAVHPFDPGASMPPRPANGPPGALAAPNALPGRLLAWGRPSP